MAVAKFAINNQFATLTHAEPRLVKKLLPPLTDLIRTTTAMSLLYECINGIIQGGILGSPDDISGREEIASLCVSKLRGMIMVKNDPNRRLPPRHNSREVPYQDELHCWTRARAVKYVALLAFNKIVTTHPFLVAEQEDVILECIDSRDITIRVKALDLVQGIVSSSNLMSIVTRLMRQLKSSGSTQTQETDDCDEDPDLLEEEQQARRSSEVPGNPPLPEDYRVDVMSRILSMCSQDNYGHLVDFDWYIDILTQLVRSAPPPKPRDFVESSNQILGLKSKPVDIAANIGNELRNVAVRVRAYRISAVRAAETIMARLNADIPLTHPLASGALEPILWILGEFADNLSSPEYVLNLLLHLLPRAASPEVLSVGLQSTAKMLAKVAGDDLTDWTLGRKSRISLLLARVISVFEPLSRHPSLEVQERAVEFVELLKLTAEAVSNQPASTNQTSQDTPLLLTQAIPSLFSGWELNSVAPEAQRNVPVPEGLDLDEPIHPNLGALLATADHISLEADETDEFDAHYHRHPEPPGMTSEPAINRLVEPSDEAPSLSYQQQQPTEDSYLDADIVAKRKAERIERNRDDPFYIGAGDAGTGSTLTPIHNILQTSNGPDLDIDAIPVMQLDLDRLSWSNPSSRPATGLSEHPHKKSRPMNVPKRVVVTADETLGGSMASTPRSEAYGSDGQPAARSSTKGKSIAGVGRGGLLSVDSSNLRSLLSLEGEGSGHPGAFEKQQREEAEMAAAVKEVERLRLQMQRASERIQVAEGVEVVSVKSKKAKTKKNKNYNLGMTAAAMAAVGSARKKEKAAMKKKGVVEGEEGRNDGDGTVTMATKVKKKKKSAAIEEAVDAESSLTGGAGAEEKVVVVTKTTKTKKKKAARIAAIED